MAYRPDFTVLVGQDDFVLEIGGEHVRFIAGIFGVEQQALSIRHTRGGTTSS